MHSALRPPTKRHPGERRDPVNANFRFDAPSTQRRLGRGYWIPAFAGMTAGIAKATWTNLQSLRPHVLCPRALLQPHVHHTRQRLDAPGELGAQPERPRDIDLVEPARL